MAGSQIKHVSGERHEHQKELNEALEEIAKQDGKIIELRHTAVNGPYERMMVSTLILYEVSDE